MRISNRPDNLDTVKLTLELLRRIPRNRKVTAQELHEQLRNAGIQREVRTIQRQLESLCEHFDIECDNRSKPYGYKWKEFSNGFSLPTLSEQECLLLALTQRHLQNLLPASVLKSMEPFFRQAQAQLNPLSSKGKAEKEWLKKIKVVSANQPLLPPKLQDGVFDAVSAALYKNQWLDIDYRNASGKRQTYSVMPLGLAQQGERLYLVCRYRGYDNERSLALHRILSATITGLPFDYPEDFDLQRYEDEGRFSVGNGQKIALSFTVTKKAGLHLLESPLSTDQKVVEHDDSYAITATVVDSLLLNRWLLGFGNDISHIERTLL